MVDSRRPDDLRIIAIDWSGKKTGAERTIWLAEVLDGTLLRLEDGRTRDQIVCELEGPLRDARQTVVGLDFAFSMPDWFVREHGARSAVEFWDVAACEGERWLKDCEPPFWGHAGSRKSRPDAESLRATDVDCASRGFGRPKSVFQVGGAGAVGTGSLRGMPALRALHDLGYAIWPFCAPASHTVIEIYPRAFTGPVVKSQRAARESYLAAHFPALCHELRALAASTDDAFDAAVSALRMWGHRDRLVRLEPIDDDRSRIEGAIWLPAPAAGPEEATA